MITDPIVEERVVGNGSVMEYIKITSLESPYFFYGKKKTTQLFSTKPTKEKANKNVL